MGMGQKGEHFIFNVECIFIICDKWRGSMLNFLDISSLKELESDSGYLKIVSLSFLNARIALGLGPKADSFADSFIGLSIFLN